MLTVLEVCLRKPAVYKLKTLGVGKLESYKSMGEPQNGGRGGTKFLKLSGVEQKGGDYDFLLKFSGGGRGGRPWRKLCIMQYYMSGLIHLVRSQNFPKNYYFFPSDTHTFVYVPGGKKC